MYVPKIYVVITILKLNGLLDNITNANKLKIILSNNEDTIVDTLFLNQRNFLFVIFDK